MSDIIEVLNIQASGNYGVTEQERSNAQILHIDVQLDVDLHKAGVSDTIEDTVDYSLIHRKVVAVVETSSFKLLEALVEKILLSLFEDKRIRSARVKVAKPALLNGATPSVTMQRSNT